MHQIDEFIEGLGKTIKDWEVIYTRKKRELPPRVEICRDVRNASNITQALPIVMSFIEQGLYLDISRISSNLSLLYSIHELALQLKIFDTALEHVKQQLIGSGMCENIEDGEEVQQLKTILAESIRRREEAEKNRKDDLFFVS